MLLRKSLLVFSFQPAASDCPGTPWRTGEVHGVPGDNGWIHLVCLIRHGLLFCCLFVFLERGRRADLSRTSEPGPALIGGNGWPEPPGPDQRLGRIRSWEQKFNPISVWAGPSRAWRGPPRGPSPPARIPVVLRWKRWPAATLPGPHLVLNGTSHISDSV